MFLHLGVFRCLSYFHFYSVSGYSLVQLYHTLTVLHFVLLSFEKKIYCWLQIFEINEV